MTAAGTAVGIPANPFVGPRSFRTREVLFGRSRETQELVDLLIAERIVLLYSPSGAGKTSLVQAALIPKLKEEGFAVRPVIRVNQEPSPEERDAGAANRYVFSALRSLERALPADAQIPTAELAGMTLFQFLHRAKAEQTSGEADVLVFDQFEEILTVAPNDVPAKEVFFDQVGAALRDRGRWALFSMREDFVPALDPYLRRIPRRLTTRYRLDLLGVDAAHQAIQGPAQAADVPIPEDVAATLVDDLRRVRVQHADGSMGSELGPFIEPVQLQIVCYRSWDTLVRTGRIGVDAARIALGDVDDALAGYYADRVAAIAAATGVGERTIRDWCEGQLLTDQGFRGQVLREFGASRGLDNRAVSSLIDAHLVRAEDRRGVTWFELAHDRLIEPMRKDNAAWRERNLNAAQRRACAVAPGRTSRRPPAPGQRTGAGRGLGGRPARDPDPRRA